MEILCDDHFVVAASTASQWATRKKIALKDLMNEQWILFHEILEGDLLAGCPLTSGAGGDDEMVIAQDLHIHIFMCERLQEPTQHYIDAALAQLAEVLLGRLRFDNMNRNTRILARGTLYDG